MKKYKLEANKIFVGMTDNMSDILFNNECIVAGGIISRIFSGRSLEGVDIDVYFRSPKLLANALYSISGKSDIVFDYTDKSIMIKSGDVVVQFIIIDYFDSADKIFEKFDYTCVMGAYDCREEEFYFHDDFLLHNAQRKLVYNHRTSFPIISALRVDKYRKEGYSISKMEYLKVLMSIMNLNISTWDEAEKQLGKFYGVSLADVIKDETKDKEFSPESLLQAISDYEFEIESFVHVEENKKSIPNFEKFVSEISGYKRPLFKWGNERYYFELDGEKIAVSKNNLSDYGDIIDTQMDKLHVYKFVNRNESGVLESQWSNKFKYVIGENAVDNNHGLYFYYREGMESCRNAYGNDGKRVLLECEVVRLKEEGSYPSDAIRCNEVKVLRIVPTEEVDKMIGAVEPESNEVPF